MPVITYTWVKGVIVSTVRSKSLGGNPISEETILREIEKDNGETILLNMIVFTILIGFLLSLSMEFLINKRLPKKKKIKPKYITIFVLGSPLD